MNKEAFHHISYGLYYVCTSNNNKLSGYIANTAFQVTSSPVKMAISVHKDNFTLGEIRASGIFSVSVLGKETAPEMIGIFGFRSGKDIDKFEDAKYKVLPSGCPAILTETVSAFDCKVVNEMDLGSHVLVIGEVNHAEVINSELLPLTYSAYKKERQGFAPPKAPTFIDPQIFE